MEVGTGVETPLGNTDSETGVGVIVGLNNDCWVVVIASAVVDVTLSCANTALRGDNSAATQRAMIFLRGNILKSNDCSVRKIKEISGR